MKFRIRTRLIESFPLTYRRGAVRKRSCTSHQFTPVHTLRQLKRDEGLFPPLPISLPDRNGLKNRPRQIFSVCVCEVWWQSVQRCQNSMTKPVRTCPQYSDHVRCLRNAFFCTFECSYFSVLRPILLKLHTLTHLIESFPTVYGLWSCIEIEMLIPLGA